MAITDTKEKVIRSIKTELGATIYLIEPNVGHRFFRYQPGNPGEDSFSYRIRQSGQESTATVKVIVKKGEVIPPELDEKGLLNKSLGLLMECMKPFLAGTPGTDALMNILDITEGQVLENKWIDEVFNGFDKVFDSVEFERTGKFDMSVHAGTYIYGDGIGSVGNPDIGNQIAVYKDLVTKSAAELQRSKQQIDILTKQVAEGQQYATQATATRKEAEKIFAQYNKTMALVKADKETINKIEELERQRAKLMHSSPVPDPKIMKKVHEIEMVLDKLKTSTKDDAANLAMAKKLKEDYEKKNAQYLELDEKAKEAAKLSLALEQEKAKYNQLSKEHSTYVAKLAEMEKTYVPPKLNWVKKNEPTDRVIIQFPASKQSIKNDAQYELNSYYYTEVKFPSRILYLPVSTDMSLTIDGKRIMQLAVAKIEYHVQGDAAFPISGRAKAYVDPYEINVQLDNRGPQDLRLDFVIADSSQPNCKCEFQGAAKLAHSDFSKLQPVDITIPKAVITYDKLSFVNLGGLFELSKMYDNKDIIVDQAMVNKALNIDILYDGKPIADVYYDITDEQVYAIYSDKSKENISKRFERLFEEYLGKGTTGPTASGIAERTAGGEAKTSWVGEFIDKEVLTKERKEKLTKAFVEEKKV